MNKKLVISVLCLWCIWNLFAKPVRCTGFEESDAKIWNSSKNVSCKIVEAGKDEIIPEGNKYFKVTMTIKDGSAWMNFKMPIAEIPSEATKITMWIKGSLENDTRGPSLNLSNWYWNGLKANRIIDISESGWVKYEFKIDDFVVWKTKNSNKMKINEHPYLYMTFYNIFNNSGTINFCIDNIEVE